MKIAIIGGSGFIGSHVVDAFMDAGHFVTVLDRVSPHREDVDFVEVDICDVDRLCFSTKGCDYIFHLAAVSNVNDVLSRPMMAIDVNVAGTVGVLEAALYNKVKRVFYASTVWVYTAAHGHQVSEDSLLDVAQSGHIYTTTKIASEMLYHNYYELHGLPFTILRYGIPYGPRMRRELVISCFLEKALKGEPLTITGDGTQKRNFLYVEDLARAHVLALRDIAENQTYNLEAARSYSIKELATIINEITGNDAGINYIPARPGDYTGKVVSSKKAESELGWKPEIDFDEGLRRTIEWYNLTNQTELNGAKAMQGNL